MKVNTLVVRALMALRLIDDATLSHLLQIPMGNLQAWLYDEDAESVPYHRQLEVLALLGIGGAAPRDTATPRDDLVHHWTVIEPWTGDAARIYWAIEVMTRAFGRAQVVFVAPESDPALTFKAVARYGLRFENFYALLEVRCPAFLSMRFNPSAIPGLSWMPGNFGLLLESDRMPELLPGVMQVEQFAADVSIPQELLKWDRLSKLASSTGFKPEDLAKWIVTHNPQLEMSSAVISDEDHDDTPLDGEDALFTADEPEEIEAEAGIAPKSPEAVDKAVSAVADVDDVESVGPTGAPPRRRHPGFRTQHGFRRQT